MTREELWFENQHYDRFNREVLSHPLFIEAMNILDDKIPIETRPKSHTPPNDRAGDQKHWDDGWRMALNVLRGLGMPRKPKSDHQELPPEYDYIVKQQFSEPEPTE